MGGVVIMLIILDKNSNKVKLNAGSNSLFPSGNIPNVILKDDEIAVRCHDNSEFAKQIKLAYDYTLEFDKDGNITAVNIIKTKEQYDSEKPPPPPTLFDKTKIKYNAIDKTSVNPMELAKRIEILEELLRLKE
jgi:hypothetical protein